MVALQRRDAVWNAACRRGRRVAAPYRYGSSGKFQRRAVYAGGKRRARFDRAVAGDCSGRRADRIVAGRERCRRRRAGVSARHGASTRYCGRQRERRLQLHTGERVCRQRCVHVSGGGR